MELLPAEKAAQIFLEKDIITAVFSKPENKTEQPSKIKIRKILLKNTEHYQIEEFRENKAFHKNILPDNFLPYLVNFFVHFKTAECSAKEKTLRFLKNKKGLWNLKQTPKPLSKIKSESESSLHDNTKNYVLPISPPPQFLKELNFFTAQGSIINSKYGKFRQINKYLEFIESVLPALTAGSTAKKLNIIDFGCGKAYLSFALYYYLTEIKKIPAEICGLDLKKDVIDFCNELSRKCNFSGLSFKTGDISSFEFKTEPDMVISLHACDTATDFALAKAIQNNAKVIFAVPCCQHELNAQIRKNAEKITAKNNLVFPMFDYGIVTEKFTSLLTDTVRSKILEKHGYKVNVEEFIDTEHTPKNILIKAVKTALPAEKMQEKIKTAEFQLNLIKEYFFINPLLENISTQK